MNQNQRTAYLFPGQGSQCPGMGKDFYEQIPVSQAVYDQISEICSLDLKRICFEENAQLNCTRYTQIAMFTTSLAIWSAFREAAGEAAVHAGLSLGELTALAASGILEAEELAVLVQKRGAFMEEAYPLGGAMAAVLGADAEMIEEACAAVDDIVSVANYNCPGQIVITGKQEAVSAAGQILKDQSVKRILPLKVSGPFHCSLLKEAAVKMKAETVRCHPADARIPYVSNVEADYVTSGAEALARIPRQIVSPVRWEQSVREMLSNGIDTFVELGPGKTLNGFLRKIDRRAVGYSVQTVEDMKRTAEALSGGTI